MTSYRTAGLADLDALALIRAEEWETVEYWRRRIGGYLSGELNPRQALAPRVVLVAAEGDRLVGFIAGHLTRRFDCDGELEWINVARERRRSGVAKELLRRLAEWFGSQGASRVCVDVDPENPAARAFYLRNGAKELHPHWLVWDDITRAGSPDASSGSAS